MVSCLSFLHPSSLIPHPFNHERAVLRAEADTVAEGDAHALFARKVRNVIEIAVGVWLVQVDGWWNQICVHGAECGGDSSSTARALRMTDLRFGRGHRDALCFFTKREFDCL